MKKKLLFVFDHEYEYIWRDGLWAAVELLKKDFDINKCNRQTCQKPISEHTKYDFVLGWGGFNSSVDIALQEYSGKKGICLGGYARATKGKTLDYDVLFYETNWSLKWLQESGYYHQFPLHKTKFIHAFGVNTNIYKPMKTEKIWDYITVGAFATWKNFNKLIEKPGHKLAIGQFQKNNAMESGDIVWDLILNGITVSDMVPPKKLALLLNSSKKAYAPMMTMGGGERFVWEAKACGCQVEVESDNEKLLELMNSNVKNQYWYATQLKKGILNCL